MIVIILIINASAEILNSAMISITGTSNNNTGVNNNNNNQNSHQTLPNNNHQGSSSNNNNVLTTTEIYWKTELGETSPPSMCLTTGAQGTILVGRQGSEGPDDLRVNNLGQHHPSQPPTPTNPYDAIANAIASSNKSVGASAFTPIQTVPFHVTRKY